MRDRKCPQCDSEMHMLMCGSGSVWECEKHGIRDWFFEDQSLGGFGFAFHR